MDTIWLLWGVSTGIISVILVVLIVCHYTNIFRGLR